MSSMTKETKKLQRKTAESLIYNQNLFGSEPSLLLNITADGVDLREVAMIAEKSRSIVSIVLCSLSAISTISLSFALDNPLSLIR